jgi:Circularly permutated YpsA SLOG family
VQKIVSGGQTGVDRAALDVALSLGVPCGGWCPKGRRAEDGRIPARYPVTETDSTAYSRRTEWNIRDSDGTLILADGHLRGGTLLTRKKSQELGKACLVVDLSGAPSVAAIADWLREHSIRVLNVAGPRASQAPELRRRAMRLLRRLLARKARRI